MLNVYTYLKYAFGDRLEQKQDLFRNQIIISNNKIV